MSRNLLIAVAVSLVAILFAGAYVASPYFAANSLKSALKSGDRDALEQDIDFPAVRDDLKSQLNAAFMRKLTSDPSMKDNPFAGIGVVLGPAIVDRLLDTFVTPDSFANLSRQNKDANAGDPQSPFASAAEGKSETRYVDLNRFEIVSQGEKGEVALVMRRTGLFGWRVERIRVPTNLFDNGSEAAASATPPAAIADDALASNSTIDTDASAPAPTAIFNDQPNFAAYPAEPFTGTPVAPDFAGRDHNAADYHTRIMDGLFHGPRFAGSFALVEFGCGTDCSTGYAVNLRTGEVLDLPVGGEDDPDMQIIAKPNSRLMEVLNQVGGMNVTPEVCSRRFYLFNGRTFTMLPNNTTAAGQCPDLENQGE